MSNLGVHKLPALYSLERFSFMRPRVADTFITDNSVVCPPALWVVDGEGATWTLGFDYSETEWRTGRWEYDILRNGRKTGEFGRIIEMKVNSLGNKVVRIWGADGWRTWSGRTFV